MAPFGPFLSKDDIEKINKAQREGAKSGYGKPSPGPYSKVTTSVKNSKTDKMVAQDNKKYGTTVPSGSFGISQKGKELLAQPKPEKTQTTTTTAAQPKPEKTQTTTTTAAQPKPEKTQTTTKAAQPQTVPIKVEPYKKPTSTPTGTAPTTPEKPLASKNPSIERRVPQGAERVDKMAARVGELRAMRARSQSRIAAQGGTPATSAANPTPKTAPPPIPTGSTAAKPAAATPVVKKPVRMGMRNRMRAPGGIYGGRPAPVREDMDAFDIILEYLLENGHVDSLDEALYVMMEMDSKVIQEIVSEETEDSLRDRRQERGGVDGNQRYPSDKGVKKGAMSPEEKKKSREKSKSALDHVRSSITKQYGAGAIYKKKEKKDKDKDED